MSGDGIYSQDATERATAKLALWFANDQGLYEIANSHAKAIVDGSKTLYAAAETINEFVSEMSWLVFHPESLNEISDEGRNMISDLSEAGLGNVNYVDFMARWVEDWRADNV